MSPNPNAIAAAEAFNLPLTSIIAVGVIPAVTALIVTSLLAKRLSMRGTEITEADIGGEAAQHKDLPPLWAALSGPVVTIAILLLRPIAGITIDPLIALPVGGIVGAIAMGKTRDMGHYFNAGLAKMSGVAMLLVGTGADSQLIIPLLLGLAGIALAWMNLSPNGTQLLSMLGGIALIFMGWAIYVSNVTYVGWGTSPRRIMLSGFIMIACIVLAVMPWANAMLQRLSREQALKEREEERADMTAHLHDGVLQTLALIQLHSEDPATVFTLARGQERELREWLYQERSTSDRSVSAGLKQIAAEVEDEHGKPIEVVTVGDAHPSAQTDALLDATRQALVNAVTHGSEPISLYCEATDTTVEVFVRDHGEGFDIDAIPPDRLGIRESIIGRIKRRGGTVEIVSRAGWGTEVRMHMPIALKSTQGEHR